MFWNVLSNAHYHSLPCFTPLLIKTRIFPSYEFCNDNFIVFFITLRDSHPLLSLLPCLLKIPRPFHCTFYFKGVFTLVTNGNDHLFSKSLIGWCISGSPTSLTQSHPNKNHHGWACHNRMAKKSDIGILWIPTCPKNV